MRPILALATAAAIAAVVTTTAGAGPAPPPECFGEPATIVVTPDDDSIEGTEGRDVIARS